MPKKVLLADDSTTIHRLVELSFAGGEFSVTSVGDGDQAVEAIRVSPPDLVLADIGMPGRSGYEVAEFIRSQPGLVSMPVLLLAGAFDAIDAEKARRVGADGILTKPFDPHVLVGRVQELLGTGRSAPTVITPARVTSPSLRAAGIPAEAPALSALPAIPAPAAPPDATLAASPAAPSIAPLTIPPPAPTEDKPASAPSSSRSDTERYFEELDQAFEALSKTSRPLTPLPRPDETPTESEAVQKAAALPSVPPASRTVLTDAFAALLEAEQAGTGAVLPIPAAVPAPAIDVNALADQIARRVLEQLTDRVVRETVAEIVATTAERLVREEIEQIKRNIT